MSRSSKIRLFKEAMLLICEGTKTEPNFFAAFRDDKDKCRVKGEITIQPKPSLAHEDIVVQQNRGNTVRQKRALKSAGVHEQPIVFPGAQPLNWVTAGINSLDTFEEVWCIFDKDDHPTRKDAFELAESQQRLGKNIRIAFSSRCIEFYFLLHFEYLYKAFEKSECNGKENGKTRSYHCCLPNAVKGKACQGDCCTNGYARTKGYWTDSKSDYSLYPILKDRLFYAIRNAELVRRESLRKENPAIPFYDRNPYVTTDRLISRLMGFAILFLGEIVSIKQDSTILEVCFVGKQIVIQNNGGVSFAMQTDFVERLDYMTGEPVEPCGKKGILEPDQQCVIQLKGQVGDLYKINSSRQPYLLVL